MTFVQNFPFFSIILCLLCAVTTFVAVSYTHLTLPTNREV